MRVLGIDPGLTRCGLGVVDGLPGRRARLVHVSVARSDPGLDVDQRLLAIERALEECIEEHAPDTVAVERVFAQHNVSTVMGTAQVAGIAMLAVLAVVSLLVWVIALSRPVDLDRQRVARPPVAERPQVQANRLGRGRPDDVRQGRPDHVRHRTTRHVGDVRRRVADHQVRLRARQQDPVGLHRAGDADGLVGARVEVHDGCELDRCAACCARALVGHPRSVPRRRPRPCLDRER